MRLSLTACAVVALLLGFQGLPMARADLLAYYSFDNPTVSGSTVADLSGNGHTGTFNSHVTPGQPGKYGESFRFDGAVNGSEVAVPYSSVPPYGNSFSLSLWFNTSNLGQQVYLLHRGTYVTNQNSIIYGYGQPNWVSLFAPAHTGSDPGVGSQIVITQANAWNNVVYTYDGSHFRGYLNGTRVFDNSITFSLTATGDLFIGSSGNRFGFGGNFAGNMDEVSIWDRALTQDEISSFQNNPIGTPEPSTLGLLGLATVGLLGCGFRRRKRAAS